MRLLFRVAAVLREPHHSFADQPIEMLLDHSTTHAIGIALTAAAVPLWMHLSLMAECQIRIEQALVAMTAGEALPLYRACGVGHQGVLMIRRGDIADGLELLSAGMDYGAENKTSLQFFSFCSELAHALGKAGQITAGLAAIDDAIDYSDHTEERWMMPEFMRVKGELLLLQSCSDEVATAEDQFRKAIDEAARQGALSWELRAATSLARLRLDQGHAADAIAVLQPVYDRFTEGFATADLKAAKALLDALG